jgi:hypothetical protein
MIVFVLLLLAVAVYMHVVYNMAICDYHFCVRAIFRCRLIPHVDVSK